MSAAEAAKQAARMSDPIQHGFGLLGMLGGMLLGAVVGAILVVATIATGGGALAIALAAMGAVGATAGGGLAGGQLARGLQTIFGGGGIVTGATSLPCSTDVLTGGLFAARAQLDGAVCSGWGGFFHIPLPQTLIAEGSSSVLVNGMPAARQGDKLQCGADIKQGETSVLIGGNTVRLLEVNDIEAKLGEILGYVGLGALVAGLVLLTGGAAVGAISGVTLLQVGVTAVSFMKANELLGQIGDAIGPGWRDTLQGGFGIGSLIYGGYRGARTLSSAGRTGSGQPTPRNRSCNTSGCPINMVTGEELLEQTDFVLSGPLPLVWTRTYRSSFPEDYGLGYGCNSFVTERLKILEDEIIYQDNEGRFITFPKPDKVGEAVHNTVEHLTLVWQDEQIYRLVNEGEADKHFAYLNGSYVLTALRDRIGNQLTFHYTSVGRLQAITTTWGRGLSFTHDTQGHITAVFLQLNGKNVSGHSALVRYEYSATGDLITVTDATGHSERFEYQNHVITKRTLKSGYNFYFEWDRYDIHAHCLRNWGDNGYYNYQFEWDIENRISRATDSRGATFTYHYDERGQIITEIDPEGYITQKEYDKNSNLITITDPNGNQEGNQYDEYGRLTIFTDAQGQTQLIEYNDAGDPITLTDALGNKWQREYNDQGLLLKTIDPKGNQTRYDYNEQGLPIRIQNAQGYRRHLHWDTQANLIAERNTQGQITHYQYDFEGNICAIIGSDNSTTRYSYDPQGQITQVSYPNGTHINLAYNALGLLTHYTDTAGRTTEYQYHDGLSQVTCRIDPNGQCFQYQYDDERNLIGLINEKGEQYQLNYDLNERLIEEIGFDGRTQKYRYDPAGHLISHLDGQDRITQFHRDPLGRLLEKSSNDEDKSEYAYDARGYIVKAANAHREVKFTYDELGYLTEEHQDNKVIKHSYDTLGNRIHSTLPDEQFIDYAYNSEGLYYRIKLNGQNITYLERDAFGREIYRRQGQAQSHFDYDPMGRLQQHRVITAHSQQSLIRRSYRYDNAGNLALIDDLRKGRTQFKYDALDRLSQVTGAHSEIFAFDPASNLLAHNQTSANYAEGHRLKFFGDRHFEYDDVGNLIQEKRGKDGKLVTHYHYDTQNQLIQVKKQNNTISYQYDALGRRVTKQDTFGKTTFLWNGDVLLSETRRNIHKTYLYEPDSFKPLALVQDNQIYYYHLDHLGTPQEITDTQGQVVWSVSYHAYGNIVYKQVEQIENNLRFQGQYFDAETGLHYNRFRYYDPGSGRFISQDPIGFLGSLNNYQYVPNPITWIDPLGLVAKDCSGNKTLRSRKEAFNEAKRDLGIPKSQRSLTVKKVNMTDRSGKNVLDGKTGKPIATREYHYKLEDGSRVVIQEHSAGHPQFSGQPASKSHFNVRDYDPITGNGKRTSSVTGFENTAGHYLF